jgi:hypothetical protein
MTAGILPFVPALLLLTREADGGVSKDIHGHFIQFHFIDDVPGILCHAWSWKRCIATSNDSSAETVFESADALPMWRGNFEP